LIFQAALTQPKIIGELGGKIPANVRQSYLNHLVAEYLKLCPNPSDAYSKVSSFNSFAAVVKYLQRKECTILNKSCFTAGPVPTDCAGVLRLSHE
jgi:hypothetical protein